MEHPHFVDEELLNLVNHGDDVDPPVLENLREDENGITEVLRFENDNESVRRVRRRCIPNEDVDAQYKLFLENLREDGNSYAVKVFQEDGVPEVIRYHQDGGASVRQIQRRCIPNADVDPQYKLFLENLREDGNSYAVEVVQEDGVPEVIRYHQDGASVRQIRRRCIPNADVDPQYKLFLDNLREDGNSYAVEVVQENGIPEVIRYHQDCASVREQVGDNIGVVSVLEDNGVVDPQSNIDVISVNECSGDMEEQSGDNIDVISVNECSGDMEEQSGDNIDVMSVHEVNGVVNPQSNIGCMAVHEDNSIVDHRSNLFLVDDIGVVSVHEDNGVGDPQTNFFIGNSQEDRASNSAQLLDEEETESQNTLRNRRSEALLSSKDIPKKKSLMVKKNVNVEAADPVSARKKECLNKRSEASQSSKDLPKKKSLTVKNNVNLEAADQVSGRKKERPNKRPDSQSLYSANSGRNHEANTESISDESYKKFQSSVKAVDGITIFTPNGGRVTYGLENKEPEESSSDSDLIVLRWDPLGERRTPIIDLENGMASHNQFREGLMKCLKQPYDKTEHIKLLLEWTRQRPASGHAKNLRNGAIKTYSLEGEYGKPYLEVYKDLAGTIKGNDRHGSLILLRGFFYWLKNVAQEGSFKPWNDEECSKVLPSL